eukprot:scaffold4267_cov393-Prasinococcus_capsulatus_cf.AAC.3
MPVCESVGAQKPCEPAAGVGRTDRLEGAGLPLYAHARQARGVERSASLLPPLPSPFICRLVACYNVDIANQLPQDLVLGMQALVTRGRFAKDGGAGPSLLNIPTNCRALCLLTITPSALSEYPAAGTPSRPCVVYHIYSVHTVLFARTAARASGAVRALTLAPSRARAGFGRLAQRGRAPTDSRPLGARPRRPRGRSLSLLQRNTRPQQWLEAGACGTVAAQGPPAVEYGRVLRLPCLRVLQRARSCPPALSPHPALREQRPALGYIQPTGWREWSCNRPRTIVQAAGRR